MKENPAGSRGAPSFDAGRARFEALREQTREATETAAAIPLPENVQTPEQWDYDAEADQYAQRLERARLHPVHKGLAVMPIDRPQDPGLMAALYDKFGMELAEVVSDQSQFASRSRQCADPRKPWQWASYVVQSFSPIEAFADPATQYEIRRYMVSGDNATVLEELWHRQRPHRTARRDPNTGRDREPNSLLLFSADLIYIEEGAYQLTHGLFKRNRRGNFVRGEALERYAGRRSTELYRWDEDIPPFSAPELPPWQGPEPGISRDNTPPSEPSVYAEEDAALRRPIVHEEPPAPVSANAAEVDILDLWIEKRKRAAIDRIHEMPPPPLDEEGDA
jgi:hypothetical protein